MSDQSSTRIRLADDLQPTVPISDDGRAVSEMLSYVLDRGTQFTDGIRRHAHGRFEQAPASSVHVGELSEEFSGLMLEWVRRWPA